MNLTIILTIIILLIGMKIISSIWKHGLKDTDEYNHLAISPEFRESQLQKYTAILEKEKNNSNIIYKVSRIFTFKKDYEKAGDYLRHYVELEPEDAEGYAELSDICLKIKDITGARNAIKRAITLEPEYEEYRQLELRIALQSADFEAAQKTYNAWEELDNKRVAKNQRPHRWSPMYQIGPKFTLPDPALKAYHAALLLQQSDKAAAAEIITDMNETEREYLENLIEEDELFSGLREIYEA